LARLSRSRHVQVAALPVRKTADGRRQVLLVKTRSGRWIPPKGWPMAGVPDHIAAAREAFEEGGVDGKISPAPVGEITYRKRLKSGRKVVCSAIVFPLQVKRIARSWPEKNRRRRKWVDLDDAVRSVGLARI
jgi:8-oxo-dGTP pyrophosphatase MutT (NUDIX family)